MKKNYLWIMFCCIAILVATSGGMAIAKKNTRSHKKVRQVKLLYVQTSKSGSLDEVLPGQFTLTLNDVLPSTIWFADRPKRLTGSEPTEDFAKYSWVASGFNEDSPNAALEAEFEDGSHSVITLELESPQYDAANNKITYMANLFNGEPTEALTNLHANSNSELSGSFQHAVLFIDDAPVPVINGCVFSSYAYCSSLDLHGADVTGVYVYKGDFENANLSSATLTNANFSFTNLSGAKLKGADLKDANLSNANLTNADLTGVKMNNATNLISAILEGVDLTNADLTNARLNDANLSGANLTNAYLTAADLSGVDLTSANLTGANLINTNLMGANLSNDNLAGTLLGGTNLASANLSGANLSGKDLGGLVLTSADLSGANLSDATFLFTDLSGANLTGANLQNADLTDAHWTDGILCTTKNCDGKAY